MSALICRFRRKFGFGVSSSCPWSSGTGGFFMIRSSDQVALVCVRSRRLSGGPRRTPDGPRDTLGKLRGRRSPRASATHAKNPDFQNGQLKRPRSSPSSVAGQIHRNILRNIQTKSRNIRYQGQVRVRFPAKRGTGRPWDRCGPLPAKLGFDSAKRGTGRSWKRFGTNLEPTCQAWDRFGSNLD